MHGARLVAKSDIFDRRPQPLRIEGVSIAKRRVVRNSDILLSGEEHADSEESGAQAGGETASRGKTGKASKLPKIQRKEDAKYVSYGVTRSGIVATKDEIQFSVPTWFPAFKQKQEENKALSVKLKASADLENTAFSKPSFKTPRPY